MKKFTSILTTFFILAVFFMPTKVMAVSQTPMTRDDAQNRAENIINLKWTYSQDKNSVIDSTLSGFVTQPSQFNNVTTAQMTGIPYDWGGFDSLDSSSYNAPWSNFSDAISKGAYAGNVNTDAGYGYIKSTAGLDCSGFVQAVFNIADYKQSTSTLLDNYFTKINLSDIKHMDILDHPGDHVVIFDKWGTQNGVYGAFTYESTPDATYGGIQGTKHYFISMNTINTGYIAGRYNYILETSEQQPVSQPQTTTPLAAALGQVSNMISFANFRSNPSTSASIIGVIPKGTIVYINSFSNGWYNISTNGTTGWIYGNLISSAPKGKYVSVNNVYMLNIRSGPSSSNYIIGTLSIGQYASFIETSYDGKWYHINLNGKDGWVYSNYAKIIILN